MKEKKNILMMLFSLAFLVLIFTVISAFFDSFYVLRYASNYKLMIGIFELITAVFGIAFCTFYVLEFFMKQSKWLKISQYVSAIVVLVFFVVFAIVSRVILPDSHYYYTSNYLSSCNTVFLAFFNVLLNITLSEVIVFLTSFFIKRIKRKELGEEQKAKEEQAQEQQPLEQEETI